jgi:hypothetical protein
MIHARKDFRLLQAPARSLLDQTLSFNEQEVYPMTRTVGAAIGAVVVLLFFASLTIEQNRALTLARAPIASHR